MTALLAEQLRGWVHQLALLITLAALPTALVLAQPLPAASSSAKVNRHSASVPASGPAWADLTLTEQQALQPLAASWDHSMSAAQKRKWLQISKNHSSLSPSQQAALHKRMSEWVAMSPQQRAQARLNFGKTQELSQQLTPEEKQAKWQSYQALSPEEKQKLAAKAAPNPKGAATATKPVAPQKLAPLHRHDAAKLRCPPTRPVAATSAPGASSATCAVAIPAKPASAARSASSPPIVISTR